MMVLKQLTRKTDNWLYQRTSPGYYSCWKGLHFSQT